MREIKNEFMQNWDGLRTAQGNQRIVVLGASNRPMDLDEAVLRRFARRIFCDLPKRPARAAILEVSFCLLVSSSTGQDWLICSFITV